MNKRKLLRQKKSRKKDSPSRPHSPEIMRLLASASAALQEGNTPVVENLCRRILGIDPKNSDAYRILALAFENREELETAISLIGRALALAPDNIVFNCDMARLLARTGDADRALVYFEKAAALDPRDFVVLCNLISLYEKTNQLDKMKQSLRRALAMRPDTWLLHYQLAKAEYRESKFLQCRDRLLQLIPKVAENDLKQTVYHLLGQACDKLGEFDQAFEAFTTTNMLQAASSVVAEQEQDRKASLHLIDRLREKADNGLLNPREPFFPDDSLPPPILLMGFPRSGTTLAGQLLGAHSALFTLDEKNTLADLRNDFFTPDVYGRLAEITPDEIRAYRDKYRARVEHLAGDQLSAGKLLVDKNPLNFIYLEMLQIFFPDARIIFIHRDPRDVCLSCFCQHFAPNVFMNNFLSLENTFRFYKKSMDLFLGTKHQLNLPLLEIRYEDILNDMQGQTTRILTFLGLEWEEQIHAFHRQASKKYILTPSYEQVVQPLYTSSAGRWRNYEKQMTPYLDGVLPFIEAFGYA